MKYEMRKHTRLLFRMRTPRTAAHLTLDEPIAQSFGNDNKMPVKTTASTSGLSQDNRRFGSLLVRKPKIHMIVLCVAPPHCHACALSR